MSKRLSLRETWERIRTVPGLGRDVTVVAIVLAGAIAASVIMLGSTQFTPPWEDRDVIWAEFEGSPAVNPGSTQVVTIAGVEVGSIKDWRVTERGTSLLKLDLEQGHEIYGNASAVLRAVNPLNEMYIEINPGGPPARPLPEGDVIPASQTERPIQADEALSHLDDRAQLALTNLLVESDIALARAPQQLPGGLNATADTVSGFEPVLTALETRRDQISQLVTALAKISSAVGEDDERLARLADVTQQSLSVLASNDDDLRATLEQLPGLTDQLRNALSSTQDLTEQLDPTLTNLDKASEELPGALERLNATVNEFGKVVDAARPVVNEARPVVADLRPFVADVDVALDDALPVTERLDKDTAVLTSYLTDLQAFVFNTSSVFGLEDAQGGFIRGHVVVTLPDGGALPDQEGYAPPPEESGINQDGTPAGDTAPAPEGGN